MYSSSRIISDCLSNNRLDFEKRTNPSIVVPSLIQGTLDDVQIGDTIVIECEVDGVLRAGQWLKNFIFLKDARVPTWIIDNHNHAFAFWHEAFWKWYIWKWSLLVHIDQHTDLATPSQMQNAKCKKQDEGIMNNDGNSCSSSSDRRDASDGISSRFKDNWVQACGTSEDPGIQSNTLCKASHTYTNNNADCTRLDPRVTPPWKTQSYSGGIHEDDGKKFWTLEDVEDYTNSVLTIADFIVPALASWLISEALMVTGEDWEGSGLFSWENGKLVKRPKGQDYNKKDPHHLSTSPFIPSLPSSIILDLDLDYFAQGFDEKKCFDTVRYWLARADIITIATSPLFIEQERALKILKKLGKEIY